MARKRTRVWRHTPEQRQSIIDTANREKLSAAEVEKRFGISRWTYYGWRSSARGIHAGAARNGGKAPRRQPGRPSEPTAHARAAELSAPIDSAIRAQIRKLMGPIVQEELDAYLRQELGLPRRRGRPRTRV